MISEIKGLSGAEAANRQVKYGLNVLEKKKKVDIWLRLVKRIFSPLILLLLFSSILSGFLGQRTDLVVIVTILFLSLGIDAYQEHNAERSTEKLLKKVLPKAIVKRDGEIKRILSKMVTVGDIVFLKTGDLVPADAKLVEAKDLTINQSMLTGESFPQTKREGDIVYWGTFVLSGEAVAEVIGIGKNTQIGKISSRLTAARPKTEFEVGLNNFSYLLVRVTFIFSIGLLAVNMVLGHQLLESFLFVLALAIGFAPELLPMILTINLANGAKRLSKRGVIVKFLPAIENFGSMDTLCTDKTGTLTEGNTTLLQTVDIEGNLSQKVMKYAYLNSFFQAGFKNPLDMAILAGSEKITGYKKVTELPYDFYRRRLSVVVEGEDERWLITKGSPEDVLAVVGNPEKVKCNYESFSRNGWRTLAVAVKKLPKEKNKITVADEENLKLIGFLVFSDPPKINVEETLRLMKNMGVSLKVLTGDNEEVTEYICRELKIPVLGTTSGKEVEEMTMEMLRERVEKTTIFARLNPEQKQKIILALKLNKHVVGFLGDGINDAVSLRTADVGISVNNAVDVAKESADLILLKKDLRVLIVGIEAGRRTFANILKYIMMGTSSTFGNMLSLAVASVFLPFLPLLPVQVLLNDLMYDCSQVMLSRDNVDVELTNRPRKWSLKFINKYMIIFGSVSSIFDLITFYVLFVVFRYTPTAFQTGWFTESIVTQMLVVFSIRTVAVPFYKSKPDPVFAVGILAIAGLALILPYLPIAGYFHLLPLPTVFYEILGGICISYMILIELTKKYFYSRNRD